MIKKMIKTSSILFIILLLTSCTMIKKHGYSMHETYIQELQEGKTSLQDCVSVLGKPSFISNVNSLTLYYMSYNVVKKGASKSKFQDMKTLVLEFENNILKKKYYITDKDMNSLNIDKSTTIVKGSQMRFFEQILDNAGKFKK